MRPFDPRVLRLVPAARGPLVALLVLGVVAGLAAIGQAFAIAGVVLAIAQPDGRDLLAALLWAAVAFGVRGAALAATEAVATHAGAVVSGGLRARLSAALLTRRAEEAPSAQEATTLLTAGATSVEPYVARYLPTLVAAAFLPVAAIVAMATLDIWTALIPVLTVPLLPLFAALIGSSTASATNRRWRTLAALSGHFLDVMRGLPVLVSYGRARRHAGVVREVSEQHRAATVRTLRLAFLSSAALELFATISVAIVAVWVGIHLAAGSMALSVALPLILLAPEAYWPIRRVGAEFHSAADGAVALAQIADELERPTGAAHRVPESDRAAGQPADPTDRQAWVQGVSYSYDPALPLVLDGLSTQLGSLEGSGLVVLTGPSGAGKTTLLEVLAGLRSPTAGRVHVPGRAHLVAQTPFLIAGTLRDNLLARAGARPEGPPGDEHLAAALDRVGLGYLLGAAGGAHAADSERDGEALPDGLDTLLGDDGFGLSAGQRSRLALAGALLEDAPVLLLDEPTAHLDPDAEARVHGLLTELARTRLVVAISHRHGLVALADQIVEIPVAGPTTEGTEGTGPDDGTADDRRDAGLPTGGRR